MWARHHKNDRRGFGVIKATYPLGKLTDLLLIHINEGHALLNTKDQPYMFLTGSGHGFKDSTFCHYWNALVARTGGAALPSSFAATALRTVFADEYAREMPPNTWEGAATLMGTSVSQWRQTYAPSLREDQATAAADMHAAFADTVKRKRQPAQAQEVFLSGYAQCRT
jgi:hypothetical protein